MNLPYVCPYCKGEGRVANVSCIGVVLTPLTFRDCPACQGTGTMWGTEIEPTFIQEAQ